LVFNRAFTIQLGIAAGQSIQVWSEYFPNAHIHGFDLRVADEVRNNLEPLSRVSVHLGDAYQPGFAESKGFVPESMDIIIDDANHERQYQEVALLNYFKFVRPGGFYIMEDVDLSDPNGLDFEEHPERLTSYTQEVLKNNHAFFVDSAFGHRNFPLWAQKKPSTVTNRRQHDSYLVVIRKRSNILPEFAMYAGKEAMNEAFIVKSSPDDNK
jgi:hypothetical protein